MLWLIGAILLAAWIIALAFKVTIGAIHVLLALAIILFIAGFLRGRRSASTVP